MSQQEITFGRYRLHPRGGLVLGTREVHVTPKALALLRFLAERPGQVVTKEELFQAVWPETVVGDAALVTCIQELRKALRDDARRPRYIETLHRRGYRFVAKPVREAGIEAAQPVPIIVGRDPELSQLRDALARAQAGERQIVFVSGEPGIGKTSLVAAFVAAAASADVHVAWGQAIEHYGASEPYLPLLEALVRSCRGTAGERFLSALTRHAPTWLAQMPTLLSASQRRDIERRSAGVTRERMLRELTDALEAAAAPAAIVLWLEDLHWTDVSTIDWLASFAHRPERARVLVVGTYRPAEALAGSHPLRGIHDELRRQGRCREIALPSLSRPAVAEYLARRFPSNDDARPQLFHLAEAVHQRTEGSPLFMVRVLDDLVDQGVLAHVDGRWTVRDPARAVERGIPGDLQRLIERQLDRLGKDQVRLLEVASVVGAEFSSAALASAADLPEGDAETVCSGLARTQQLIHARGTEEWPDGTVATRFAFHHALYREALYERVPAGRRVELHRRLGDRLERGWGDRVTEIAGELAMHFERGRAVPRAIHYLRQAGRVAGSRGASQEAAAYLARALDLVASMPADQTRDALEGAIRLALCVPLIALHGYGSEHVESCARRAKALCSRTGDARDRFAAHRLVWNGSLMRHPVPETLALARELMDLALTTSEPAPLALAHRALGTSLKLAGELPEAADVLAKGVELAAEVPDELFAAHGEHPGMICLAFHGWVRSLMGFPDRAAKLAELAIEHARARNSPHGLAFALVSSGLVYVIQGGVAHAQAIGTEVMALAREHRLPQWLGFGQEITGWAAFHAGDHARGIELQEAGLRDLVATGARTHRSRMLANLAESYLLTGDVERARAHLATAHAHRASHGEHYYAAELMRLEAVAREMEGAAPDRVEAGLLEALETALGSHAGLLAVRAATSLARFRSLRGARDGAVEVLSSVRTSVNEDGDWPPMIEARTLLNALNAEE
jgi:DNA-binding winged helix-turn-helix (wHTH) protein